MGTPFIAFLPPSYLSSYSPPSSQPTTVPKTFVDAMAVRHTVFVEEQGVPPANESDTDDPRSCHWVIYASTNTVISPAHTNPQNQITKSQRSITESMPIGTIRLVPFPHAPHPEPGSKFVFAPEVATTAPPNYMQDRKTSGHDGIEPYVKLGRLAILPEFRGHGLAKLLAHAALTWARGNPTYFNPNVAEVGMKKLGAETFEDIPAWNGLVCVHAQIGVQTMWERWGFVMDEEMGRWVEEGIEHVGMWKRLNIEPRTSIRS
ncbi:acetyltransferase [Calycina marina]|uniref:Acetyltransferase n=1 Tax=Calycina marina TaxID=1763456 RepID=A0A9P7Z5D8_9HELO|nr:acetyltransferase [Calycina marina]